MEYKGNVEIHVLLWSLLLLQAGSLCAKWLQSLQVATAVPDEYSQFYFDGVFGIGFVTDQKDLPWFYNVMQQDELSYPVFALYLNGYVLMCVRMCVCVHVHMWYYVCMCMFVC